MAPIAYQTSGIAGVGVDVDKRPTPRTACALPPARLLGASAAGYHPKAPNENAGRSVAGATAGEGQAELASDRRWAAGMPESEMPMFNTDSPTWFLIGTGVLWVVLFVLARRSFKDSESFDWVLTAVLTGAAAAIVVGSLSLILAALR